MFVDNKKLINFSEIGELIGGEEQVMAGMYLAIQKDITGSILFLVKEEVALHLVKKLMGDYAQDIRGDAEGDVGEHLVRPFGQRRPEEIHRI